MRYSIQFYGSTTGDDSETFLVVDCDYCTESGWGKMKRGRESRQAWNRHFATGQALVSLCRVPQSY